MAKKKKKKRGLELQIQINKKDSVGLFKNFSAQIFDDRNRRERENRNTRKYLDEMES